MEVEDMEAHMAEAHADEAMDDMPPEEDSM
jgi:hypothetical protein